MKHVICRKSIAELDFFESTLHFYLFYFLQYCNWSNPSHTSFKYECKAKSKIPLIGAHACSSVREHNEFFFLFSPRRSFSSLSRSRFRVTLPWFISSTPAAELDRIIIGSCNLLMNLRRSRLAASSHVRSLDADAVDPKSDSVRCNFLLHASSFATQSQPKSDTIVMRNEMYAINRGLYYESLFDRNKMIIY